MQFLELRVSESSPQFDFSSFIAGINLIPCSLKVDVKEGTIRIYKAEKSALKKLLDLISMHYFIEYAFLDNLDASAPEAENAQDGCAKDAEASETKEVKEEADTSQDAESSENAEDEITQGECAKDAGVSETKEVKEEADTSQDAESSENAEDEITQGECAKDAGVSETKEVVEEADASQDVTEPAKSDVVPLTKKTREEEAAEAYCRKNQEDFDNVMKTLDKLEARYREERPEEYSDEKPDVPADDGGTPNAETEEAKPEYGKDPVAASFATFLKGDEHTSDEDKASIATLLTKQSDEEEAGQEKPEDPASQEEVTNEHSKKIVTKSPQEELLARFVGKSIIAAREIEGMDGKIEYFLLDIGMAGQGLSVVTEIFNLYMAKKEKQFSLDYLCSQTKRVKLTGRGASAAKSWVLSTFRNWATENCPELLKKYSKASVMNLIKLFANNI